MAYPKTDNLHNYDVYPKVVVAGKAAQLHIRPLGGREALLPDTKYTVEICALDGGTPWDFPATGDFRRVTVCTDENACVSFVHTFESEQEYFIRFLNENGKKFIEFSV